MRQPIVTILGHVDSGKTSILDNIRGTKIQQKEAGGITQHIGASFLTSTIIKNLCGELYKKLNQKVDSEKIPGILLIDTPGHEIFTNLRTRGGSAADIAILVIDINSGFQQQTIESLKILENSKVPFIIALNKIDMIKGWRKTKSKFILKIIDQQDDYTKKVFDEHLYEVIGTMSKFGYRSEMFSRISDFTKEISIIPISAVLGIGIPELMMVLIGLTQQYMQKKLSGHNKITRGIIIEIKNEEGLGATANVILIDGKIRKTDHLIAAKHNSVIITKLKTILLPKPNEKKPGMKDKFLHVDQVNAAAGIKIVSQDLDGVLPGSTIYATKNKADLPKLQKLLKSELNEVFIKTDIVGVILKCDTIGSLEVLTEMLKKEKIPISYANIGPVNRRDVIEAKTIKENNSHLGVILSFNVKILVDAKMEADNNHVKIFNDQIIYSLLDNYTKWVKFDIANEEESIFSELTPISKFIFIDGCIFRNSNPAVFGIRVDVGVLKQKVPIMNKQGEKIGVIHQLQKDGKTMDVIKEGQEAACSMHDVTIGRQIFENDVFYTSPTSNDVKQLLKLLHKLNHSEIKILNEIIELKRKRDPAYGY
ncbi:MAG: translation initiation factor IF-2 [Thaumarchaeota archaeon]|nr:translation initiation factor IF-2 [Nitrososphaerota archaeon]